MVDKDLSVITLRRSTVVRVGVGALVLAAVGAGVAIGLSASPAPTTGVIASSNNSPTSAARNPVPVPGVVSACNVDARTVETAIAGYEAQTDKLPGEITNSGKGSSYLVPSFLKHWPRGTGNYAISVVAGGRVQVTVASTPAPWSGRMFSAGSGSAATYSATACNGAEGTTLGASTSAPASSEPTDTTGTATGRPTLDTCTAAVTDLYFPGQDPAVQLGGLSTVQAVGYGCENQVVLSDAMGIAGHGTVYNGDVLTMAQDVCNDFPNSPLCVNG
jgi:hypothetical protein